MVVREAELDRYGNGEMWDGEAGIPVSDGGAGVVLGVDGGTTSTICVCLAASAVFPDGDLLADPSPVLARAVAGCSNHNSVGGKRDGLEFHSEEN